MINDCLFCSIAAGETAANTVHDSEAVLAFRDINPQAPTHILVIPRDHIGSLADLGREHDAMLAELIHTATALARREGIADSGFRIVTNAGPAAGQTVQHLHLHLLGGRQMTWPPG